jgi:molybdate transport system permease protein
VISTLIYGHVEAMEYPQAHALALGMVVFAFVVLLALSVIKRRAPRLVA